MVQGSLYPKVDQDNSLGGVARKEMKVQHWAQETATGSGTPSNPSYVK
jgi:hypothetical protein